MCLQVNGNYFKIMKHILVTIVAALLYTATPFATPLHKAAFNGDVDGVQEQLDEGWDIDSNEVSGGATPLHLACLRGHKEVVALLIDNDADVNLKDEIGRAPLQLVVCGFYKETEKEIVELLINNGANVNVKEESLGLTLLHQAAWDECIDTAQVLINNGADVNAKDTRGRTPLHSAAVWGQVEMLKILISAGADVNARTIEGLTPLHLASNLFSNKSTIEQLTENGANLNAKDNNGKTPLDTAISNSLTEIVEFLIKQGGKTSEELSPKTRLNLIRGPFGFTFNTVEGKTYIVESGINVDKWNKLREIKGTGSEVKFIDMRRIYFQKHFYRVMVVD